MITASRSNGEDKVELPGWGPEDWVKPGSCLAEVCGLEGHVCEDPGETTQAIDGIVWKRSDESKNRNGTDSRLPWRNRGESSDCTRILQHV